MHFKLKFSEEAELKLKEIEQDRSKKGLLKQVRKILGFMETNLKHPSLNTHKFSRKHTIYLAGFVQIPTDPHLMFWSDSIER